MTSLTPAAQPQGTQGDPSWRQSQRTANLITRIVAYVLVTIGAIVLMVPFAWMLSSSLKPLNMAGAEPPVWVRDPIQWRNYVGAWNALPFTQFLINTLFIRLLGMVGTIFTSALVAYGFARFRFPGRDALFVV